MDSKYITIKEFAKRVGVSPQAIYKQVDNKLNKYVKLVDNHKMIDIRALQEIYDVEVEQLFQPNIQPVEQPIQPQNQQLIDMLQAEMDKKNEQIEALQQIIKDNDKKYHELMMQAQQNLEREQQLHLLSKQRILELEDSRQNIQEQEVAPTDGEPRGFFSRLLRK
jgi:AcrR family transcriptional regulator